MSANTGAGIPITWDEVIQQQKTATQYMTSISYAPKKTVDAVRMGSAPKARKEYSTSRSAEAAKADSVAIIKIAKEVCKNDDLLEESVNVALNALRTGMQIGLHVAAEYAKASGLDTLKGRRDASRGSFPDEAEWASKQETHAAITVFVLASYVSWRFESKDEKKYTANVDFAGIPEPIAIGNQIRAVGCTLYHLGSYLEGAQTGAQFHKTVQLYCAAVLKELQTRAPSLKYLEAFTDSTYKLDATGFVIRGFQATIQGSGVTELAKRVEAKDIMGNHQMKSKLNQLANMVLAYDDKKNMNPFLELEAFTGLGVLEGQPGTGKSMGLDYLATTVYDRCKALKRPFMRRPIPNALVQSLQGETAHVFEQWWNSCYDPSFICIGEVDDAEAVFLDRRDHSSSEGSKLAVMSHLRLSEGAGAKDFGQCINIHATNNLDMMDPAVISRYKFRIRVPGAQTRNDYCDQLKSFGDRFNARAKREVIKLKFPGDYEHLSDQGLISKAEREMRAEKFAGFKNKRLQKIWDKVEAKKLQSNSYDLYGSFMAELHKEFEAFTSRDLRNITLNVGARLFDIEYPKEWLDNPTIFFNQDYDTKKNMILDLALSLQQGLSVEEVMFQVMVQYVETTVTMLDSGRKYRIKKIADELDERDEAIQLQLERKNTPQLEAAE